MADPDIKIELGSFVPHFIIYVLWKTPYRQRESERERKGLVLKEADMTVDGQVFTETGFVPVKS